MRRDNAFGRVCLCLSVCLLRLGSTFWKPWRINTSLFVYTLCTQVYIFRTYRSRPYIKVILSRSRSHEQKSKSVCHVRGFVAFDWKTISLIKLVYYFCHSYIKDYVKNHRAQYTTAIIIISIQQQQQQQLGYISAMHAVLLFVNRCHVRRRSICLICRRW